MSRQMLEKPPELEPEPRESKIADGIAIAFIVVMLAVLILEAAIAFIR
jgi:hypothetical protein